MQPADWRRYLIENGAKGIHEDDPISTEKLALLLKYKCKCEARATVLGYTQRGRTPSAYDSWFAFEGRQPRRQPAAQRHRQSGHRHQGWPCVLPPDHRGAQAEARVQPPRCTT